jgi:hypothetical protein
MTEAEVIDRINSTIKKNGNRTITGDEMNFILKAIIELIVESGGSKPLDSVLADGNETLEYDIILTELDRIVVGANRAGLSKGTFDTGRGDDKGVSLQCAIELELNWQAGYLRVLAPGGDGTPLLLQTDSEIVYTELVPTTPTYGKSLVTKDYADTKQSKTIVVSSNQIAVNDENYVNVANATYTDPSPVEGLGYKVDVLNATATINSIAYSLVGTTITRRFHSGSWITLVSLPDSSFVLNSSGAILSVLGWINYNRVSEVSITTLTTETILDSVLIQANTFVNGGILKIENGKLRIFGTAAAKEVKIYIGPNSNNLTSATPIALLTIANTSLYAAIERKFTATTTSIQGLPFNVSSNNDDSSNNNPRGTANIDWSINQYVHVTGRLINGGDLLALFGLTIKNF